MMIAKLTGGARDVMLIGLTRENVNQLLAGKPVLINKKSHGPAAPDAFDIAICFDETEQALMKTIKDHCRFDEKTEVRIDPRLQQ